MKIYFLHKYCSSSKCENFKALMRMQEEAIKKEIDENKWYMSEKAGHDVGWTEAEMDFIEKYLQAEAKKLRNTFCGEKCSYKDTCDWRTCVM